MRPISTDSARRKPLAKTCVRRHVNKVTVPTIQLLILPKSAAPTPPAKLFAPIGRSEKPIAVTTVAATTGGMRLVHLPGNSPSIPSTRPPMMTAPTRVPMPCVVAIAMARERNVKLIPITIGSLEPIFHTGYNCTRVPIPAIIIQFCIRIALSSLPRPAAPARMMIGVMLETNIASTCWSPNGMALNRGTLPSN